MQASDLIGICEDLNRHRSIMNSTMGEFSRLIGAFRTFHTEVFTPAYDAVKADQDLVIDDAVMTAYATLDTALMEAASFVEVNTVQTALAALYALDVFDPAIYAMRIDSLVAVAKNKAEAIRKHEADLLAAADVFEVPV